MTFKRIVIKVKLDYQIFVLIVMKNEWNQRNYSNI